jgi:fructose-bisphosphate aldolase class II
VDPAPLAFEAILKGNSYNPCPKAKRIEDPIQWTGAKIAEQAVRFNPDKGPVGNFDD